MQGLNILLRRVPTWSVYLAGLIPLALLVGNAVQGSLGPDPVKVVEHRLGALGLQFLLASLAITPIRRLGLNLIRYRRALGLLAFGYITLHLVAWVWLDMGLRWAEMAADLWKRPYIVFGMAGFMAMIPLAVTSSNAAIRKLGPPAWGLLHRLAYVAVAAGILHLLLLVKIWTVEEAVYAGVGLALLAARLVPKSSSRTGAAT